MSSATARHTAISQSVMYECPPRMRMQRVRAPGPFWPDFDESEATLSEMRPPTRVRTARLLLDDRDERAELPVAEEEAQPGDDADQDRDEELAVVGVDVGRDRAA
jgi:hypothetical protein